MAVQIQRATIEEFERFIGLPENADRLFEYIGGEIVEVPSNPYSSYLGARISRHLMDFVEAHDLGYVTGEAGGYMVSGERYAPDVAFVSKARQPQLARTGYNPAPPDLAVEIFSPTDSERRLSVKISNYLAAGTVVAVVYPDEQEIAIHRPGQRVTILGIDDTLDGGDILPGFRLPLKAIFPEPAG